MEQNKQKILKLLRWSVHLSFQVKPMIPNPKWCLAQPVFCWSCHQVRRLVKLYWCTEKLLLKRWAVEKGSLNSGSRRSGKRFPWCLCCPGGWQNHKHLAPGKGGFAVWSDSLYRSLSLCSVSSFLLNFSSQNKQLHMEYADFCGSCSWAP